MKWLILVEILLVLLGGYVYLVSYVAKENVKQFKEKAFYVTGNFIEMISTGRRNRMKVFFKTKTGSYKKLITQSYKPVKDAPELCNGSPIKVAYADKAFLTYHTQELRVVDPVYAVKEKERNYYIPFRILAIVMWMTALYLIIFVH